MELGYRGDSRGAYHRRLCSFFHQEVCLVIARYIGIGGGPDGEEDPAIIY
jgi:hypothetical protein